MNRKEAPMTQHEASIEMTEAWEQMFKDGEVEKYRQGISIQDGKIKVTKKNIKELPQSIRYIKALRSYLKDK